MATQPKPLRKPLSPAQAARIAVLVNAIVTAELMTRGATTEDDKALWRRAAKRDAVAMFIESGVRMVGYRNEIEDHEQMVRERAARARSPMHAALDINQRAGG